MKTTRLRFDTYEDTAGGWRWRMVDGNNRIVGTSGESFTRQADAKRATANIIDDIVSAAAREAPKG